MVSALHCKVLMAAFVRGIAQKVTAEVCPMTWARYSDPARLKLYHFKIAFAYTTIWAYPVIGYVIPTGSGCDAFFG
jgi:hypothetical protein